MILIKIKIHVSLVSVYCSIAIVKFLYCQQGRVKANFDACILYLHSNISKKASESLFGYAVLFAYNPNFSIAWKLQSIWMLLPCSYVNPLKQEEQMFKNYCHTVL